MPRGVRRSGTTLKKTFWSFTKTKTSRRRERRARRAGTQAVPCSLQVSPSTTGRAAAADRARARCAAARAARRAVIAPERGPCARPDVGVGDEREAPLLPLHPVEVADPRVRPAAPRPSSRSASGGADGARAGAEHRLGDGRPGPRPWRRGRAGSSFATGQSSFSETYSSIFSSTIMTRIGSVSSLEPRRSSTSMRGGLRLAGLQRAEDLAPLLDEDLVVAEVLQRDVGLLAAGAGAGVPHVHADGERLAALREAVAVAALPCRRSAR